MPACPFCEGEVSSTAQKCRHCGEWIQPGVREPEPTPAAASAALDAEVDRYVAAGYEVEARTTESVVLRKPKRFNWVAFVLLALLWILPAVIYLLVYATRGTPTVELRLNGSEVAALGAVLPSRGAVTPDVPESGGVTLPVGLIALLVVVGWFVYLRVQSG